MKAKAAGRLVIAAVLLCSCAVPAIADTRTEVGIFTAVAGGTHVGADNPPVSGLFPIAALDVRQHVNGVWLQFEGIPPITVSGANNGAFGSSSAHLSVVNGTVNVDLDRHRRYHLGAGFQLVNLSNFNGENGDRNYARETTPIYRVGATLPLPHLQFVELNLMVDPNVRATLYAVTNTGVPEPTKPEQGAEVDYSAAYGWRRGMIEYLVGLRGLSYHTRNNDRPGELVDRNVGGGVTFEARFLFGPKE
jgi:hypothetical protein